MLDITTTIDESTYQPNSNTDFSPIARLRLNFGGDNCIHDYVKMAAVNGDLPTHFESKMQIFETDMEQV